MDWQTLLWIGGLVALFFVMMRGCGGMAGGCGMGSRRDASTSRLMRPQGADDRANKHHAA
jgi:hypothetical protein